MTNEEFRVWRTDQIKHDIADLRKRREPLASGVIRIGDRPELHGAGNRTEAAILDIDRKIAEQEALLKFYELNV